MKQFPVLDTDEEAERFVAEADLSEYDMSGMIPLSEFMARRQTMMTEETARELVDALEELTAHMCHLIYLIEDEDALEPEDAFPDYPEPKA